MIKTAAERLIEKGIARGLEQGREQGIEQGIEKGELVGRIQTLQEILGKRVTPRTRLIGKSHPQLEAILEKLRTEHRAP